MPLRSFHLIDSFNSLVRLRARRGDVTGAVALLDLIVDPAARLQTTADLTMILANTGHRERARALFTVDDAEVAAVLDERVEVPLAASVGGARAVLGDSTSATTCFARASAAVRRESRFTLWSHWPHLLWALIECGRVDQVRAEWRQPHEAPDTHDALPLLAYLVSTGRDGLLRELFAVAREARHQWFDTSTALDVFSAYGRPDLDRDWWATYSTGWHRDIRSHFEDTAAEPKQDRPTADDIAALADRYAEIRKLPRGGRLTETGSLVLEAAACGHVSAVLDLLAQLPAEDLNARPRYAFAAVWLVSTGVDVEPW